jgi:hypothetical protein
MSTFDYILIGLLAGLAIAGGAGAHFYRRLKIQLTTLHVVNDNITALRTLNKLRSDKMFEAIELNETVLDVSVITLANLVRPVPEEFRDHDLLFHIRRAKEYRDRFPHKSKTEGFDWQVAQAFSLVG